VAYIGDGNNVANSWVQAASLLGFALVIACPEGYQPDTGVLAEARRNQKGCVEVTQDAFKAAENADVVYTDVWASMGQEGEMAKRRKAFKGYQVNSALMRKAKREALVMHCLPAHIGEEISAEVLEGPQSVVFDQAENRMHGQKAILEWLLKKVSG
jgi:ornithine carbamoyltransferase